MEQASIWERAVWWIEDIPTKIKQMFCHHWIVTSFNADTFLVDKWERCSGSGTCNKCHADFMVAVPAAKDEKVY